MEQNANSSLSAAPDDDCQEVSGNCVGLSTRDLTVAGNVAINISNASNYLPQKNPETKQKLMFQIKDPISTFTGRNEFLEDLHKSIQEYRKKQATISIVSQTSSITGLGGIGKSTTVRMYISKFGTYYDNIAWIDAEHPSEVVRQFETLAFQKLGIIYKDHIGEPREFSDVLEEVYEKLCQKPKLLLIVFDNAEALDDTGPHTLGIRQFLPPQTSTIEPPIVLITSRQQEWEDTNVIKLGLWTIEECIQYIFKRLKLEDTDLNKMDAIQLSELFDRLPIAIEVAVSAIFEQTKVKRMSGSGSYRINNFISEYLAGNKDIMRKKRAGVSSQMTIEALLNNTLDKIKLYNEGDLAIRILAFMAYLSPTNIPKKMIHALFQKENSQAKLDDALILLKNYSIISSSGSHFTIHRVFQDVVLTILPNLKLSNSIKYEEEVTVLDDLTNRIERHIIPVINPNQDDYRDVLTNILHVTNFIIQNSMTLKFYTYIAIIADFVKKVQVESAIGFYKALIDCDNRTPDLPLPTENAFKKLVTIGKIYFNNVKYEKSTLKELFQKLSNFKQETTNISRKYDQEVLKIKCYTAAATSLIDSDSKDEAFELYHSVQPDKKKCIGLRLPSSLRTKMNLADCLCKLGKETEALKIYLALQDDLDKVLGPLHPNSLLAKKNTANALIGLGKMEDALKLYFEVLHNQEEVLGPLNPHTLKTKANIAVCTSNLGDREEALKVLIAVHEEQEIVLGPIYRDTLLTRLNTANCLSDLGRTEEAMKVYNMVGHYMENVIGHEHAYTLLTKMNMATLLSEQGKAEESLKLYLFVQEKQEKVQGPYSPYTLVTKMNIAVCLSDLGRIEEAIKLYSEVQVQQEKVLGLEHPHTLLTKRNICNHVNGNAKEKSLRLFFVN